MKKWFTLISCCFFAMSLFANRISPQTKTITFNHLAEVNQEWLKQNDLPKSVFTELTTFKTDVERIQIHLKWVEQTLRLRNADHLSKTQKANRMRHLDVLKSYWQAATFPINIYHKERQPYFKDHLGTHCAVGYLLHKDGQDAFVNFIKNKNNYAYIHELTIYPQLGEWAKVNGFTVEELAWIQPGYSPPNYNHAPLGNNGGVNGDIHAMKSNPDSTLLVIAGDFTVIDGVSANGIIGWDGNTWQTFGSGVDGAIYDFAWRNNQTLIVVGDFKINNQQVNIASWDGSTSTWTPLQTGDMGGSVYTIFASWNDIYIGGDFQKVNGVNMPYLAHKQSNLAWDNRGGYIPGSAGIAAFSVDAPVKCIKQIAGQLLIGGEFTQTAPLCSDQTQQLNVNYLAYWDGYYWTNGFNGPNSMVNTFIEYNNQLYIGGNMYDPFSMTNFNLGIWNNYSGSFLPRGNGEIEDFFVFNDELFVVGDFDYSPFIGYYGRSMASFSRGGLSSPDSSVTAGAVFQNQIYFGGRFSSINGVTLNQLASSAFDPTSSNRPDLVKEDFAKVFYHQQRIVISFEKEQPNTVFNLMDATGKIVYSTTIPANNLRFEFPTSNLANGVYFYNLHSKERKQTGKLGVF